ncbi:MAG: TonB-dependent receptor [Bacteroidetes bacterium]|nr:TonB-dependent receptor [Bacteroidota bacterium]
MLVPAHLSAQKFVSTIRGRVVDKESKQPLVGVNVVVLQSNPVVGAATDEEGNFLMQSVNVGRNSIRFTYIGYEDAVVAEVLVNSGKETILNVEMQERVNNMAEVVVTQQRDKGKANNEFASVSARSFSAEEMNRYAGTLNDPARMAQSFAGVMTSNDENNQIVVRGNSPRGLLWRMEGVEIPNPNHFAGSEGATGGGVSMLSSNMLTNTDFYSGAFAAEYGNALSGVFDLNLRKGNAGKREFAIQLGVLGAEVALEGGFGKKYKGSYLVNYRYSTLELFALMGFDIGGNVSPKYQDLSFNFYFPTQKAGSFTVFGLGGLSGLGEKAKRDTATWKSFSDKTDYNQKQWMGVAGFTHLYLLPDAKTYIKSVLSYSYTNNSSTSDSLDGDFKPFNLSEDLFIYRTWRAHVLAHTKLNTRNSVRVGGLFSHNDYKLSSALYSFAASSRLNFVDNEGSTWTAQAYMQWRHRFSDRLQMNTGLHFTFPEINNKFYVEPRLGMEYKITEAQTLSLGAGLHSRVDAISTYVSYKTPNGVMQNRQLDFSRAFHFVTGYSLSFLKDFRFKTEAYVQYLFRVPVGNDSAHRNYSIMNYNEGFVQFPLQSSGHGINYGIELTVEKFFSRQYFFVFTTSLFDSRYKTTENVWRSTAYNVNYVMNALGGKEFTVGKRKNNIIGINTRIIWRGGQRYTPVDLEKSITENQTVTREEEAFSQKLPDYFRIDFGASFRRNKKKYSWIFSFDAQNIINRQNVAGEVYDVSKKLIVTKRNLGIVPVFSWKVQF